MMDEPVDLDAHRNFAAMRATEGRRQRLYECRADREVQYYRQEDLERSLATPAESWPEAAAKAQYLIQLFSATAEAQDPHRKGLVAQTLDDLSKLSERAKEHP